MKTMNNLLILIFFAFLSINGSARDVGGEAPDFTFTSIDDQEISLSDYSGNVVFLFLFGDKCPFCISVGPTTETEIYKKYVSQYDEYVALGLDMWDGSKASVQNFQASTGITYPLLLKASSIGTLYKTTYDRAVIIDREGVIRYKGTSKVSNEIEAIDKKLAEVLAEEDVIMDIETNTRNASMLGGV